MFNLLSIKPTAFGLDISDLSIRIIQLKKSGKRFKLISWGETEMPPDLIKDGEITDDNKFIELLRRTIKNVKGGKIKTKNAIVSLPEEKVFLAIIQLPAMKKEELQSAIMFQAENYIPLPIDEVYLDFQIIPPDPKIKDRFDILLVAFPKSIIDQQLAVLKKAGILPLALEIESQAISRVLSKNNTNDSPFFIINLGGDNTIFAIFSDRSLRFSASIPVSSQDMIKSIARSLKINSEEAKKLKHLTIAQSQKKEKEKKAFKVIGRSLDDLSEQVKKYIGYYRTYGHPEYPGSSRRESENKRTERIILCGKGADINGLPDFFSSQLGIPTNLANPWLNILRKEPAGLPQKKALGYITALGLALRGIENNE